MPRPRRPALIWAHGTGPGEEDPPPVPGGLCPALLPGADPPRLSSNRTAPGTRHPSRVLWLRSWTGGAAPAGAGHRAGPMGAGLPPRGQGTGRPPRAQGPLCLWRSFPGRCEVHRRLRPGFSAPHPHGARGAAGRCQGQAGEGAASVRGAGALGPPPHEELHGAGRQRGQHRVACAVEAGLGPGFDVSVESRNEQDGSARAARLGVAGRPAVVPTRGPVPWPGGSPARCRSPGSRPRLWRAQTTVDRAPGSLGAQEAATSSACRGLALAGAFSGVFSGRGSVGTSGSSSCS